MSSNIRRVFVSPRLSASAMICRYSTMAMFSASWSSFKRCVLFPQSKQTGLLVLISVLDNCGYFSGNSFVQQCEVIGCEYFAPWGYSCFSAFRLIFHGSIFLGFEQVLLFFAIDFFEHFTRFPIFNFSSSFDDFAVKH